MKIPFGLRRSDHRMVGPQEVPNGLGCECVCRGCGQDLIARQGRIKEWHFAHATGAECPGGIESAIHQMAKQMIVDRQCVYVPAHSLYRPISGPTWKFDLTEYAQQEGEMRLSDCREEVKVGERKPDILAFTDSGQQIAIEVAFTHFCDEEKIEWIRKNNLTTLEIDISIPSSVAASDVLSILEARIFKTPSRSCWLYHAGESAAAEALKARECAIRAKYAKADEKFLAQLAVAKEKQKRREAFLESIRDVDEQTYRFDRDLTLRIAFSKIRVTMKGHGYFKNVAPDLKKIILDAADRFGGRFLSEYKIWEFRPPEDRVVVLYDELCDFIRTRLNEKPAEIVSQYQEKPKQVVALQLELSPSEQDFYEERAGILESEGNLSREDAEQRAYSEVIRRRAKVNFQ